MGRQSARIESSRVARVGALVLLLPLMANCAGGDRLKNTNYSPKVVADGEPVPRGGGSYRVGNPYTINGRTYYPEENPRYRAEGIASWYGADFHGRQTANGEVYDMDAISAAHPTMPLPSYARVTHLENGRSIIVRVNDRGPYAHDRIIDLSKGAAKALGAHGQGVARVRVEYVGPAALAGSDDRALLASLREGSPAPAPSRSRVGDKPLGSSRQPERPTQPRAPALASAPTSALPSARAPASVAPEYAVRASEPTADSRVLGLMSGRGLY
jgi:rare lipoprotein A